MSISSLKKLSISLTIIVSNFLLNSVQAGQVFGDRKIIINKDNSSFRLTFPKETKTAATDGDYYYLASDSNIRIVPKSDVFAKSEDDKEISYSLLPFWEISLKHELAGEKINDIAVQRTQGSHVIYISTKSRNNSFDIKAFAIRSSVEEESLSRTENFNDIGLFAVKGGGKDIAGNGEITVIREPNDGSGILVSLDTKNRLIHTYSLKRPLVPQYVESFQVDEIKGYKDLKLKNESKTGTSFQVYNNKFLANLSIYDLRAKAKIKRANALINLEREINGKSWIKNFLFLGLFSNVIDYLDNSFKNPSISVSDLEKDPILSKLYSGVVDEDVFEYLEVNRLLTRDEINQYRLDYNLNKANGGKWFFTVAVLAGTLKFLQIKSKAPSINAAVNQYKRNLYDFSKKLIKPESNVGRYVYRISNKVEKAQLALRSKLIRNYYNMEYPAHAIVSLRKLAQKAKFISPQDAKEVSKMGYEKQYQYLKSVINRMVSLNVDSQNYKQTKKIIEHLEMTDFFVKKVQINRKFRSLKSQVLALLKKHHPDYKNVSLKSDDMVAYILATDEKTVLAKVDELEKVLKNIKGYKFKEHFTLKERIKFINLERLAVQKVINGYGTEGRVAKVWDRWAAFTQSYSCFFTDRLLPKNVQNAINRNDNYFSKFFNEHTRLDAVKTGKSTVEYVKISGEHARSAFWLGITDTIGETVSQTAARATLVDPNERSIGSGDNYLELFSINGKDYGVHFDLIVHDFSNLIGWWLGMPLGLAKSGMSFGAKGKVTLSKRLFDGLKKSFNPANYIYGQATLAWPVLELTTRMMELDYLQDHRADFDEKEYSKFRARIRGRLTSWKSFLERKMLGTVVNLPYVNPQFFMQAEFDKVARSLFNSSLPGTMVSSLVMPLTSGFFPNRAYGEYFGTNNPYMINLLKKFGAEGILEKIDVDGYTDINTWTEIEKSSFYNIMVSLEMAKLSKTQPLSRSASIEEQTQWFIQVGNNLFGENFTDIDMEQLNPKIKIADSSSSGGDFRYAQEAKEILEQIEAIRKQTTILPFVKEPYSDNSAMVIKKIEGTGEALSFNDLSEVAAIQAKLNDAIEALNSNQSALSQRQKISVGIAIYDTLYLLNSFLMNNKLADKTMNMFVPIVKEVERFYYFVKNTRVHQDGNWVNFRQKRLNFSEARANSLKLSKIGRDIKRYINRPIDNMLNSNLLIFGTIPIYLWMDNQIEAHVRIEEHLANLISELQEILFSMTKVIVSESIKENLDLYSNLNELKEYREVLLEKERLFKSVVENSKEESEKYLDSRIYRMPKILATSGPIGMSISGLWMLTHYLLHKNSKNFVKKMSDQFAPGLFKYSLILWISAGQINNLVEKNMYLHTVDFIKLHSAYYTTLLELELIDKIIASDNRSNLSSVELFNSAAVSLKSHEGLRKLNEFRSRLEELSIIGENVESE